MMFQEELKKISSYVSKLLRQKFGRGPEACFASAYGNYLVVTIRGFMSPMEEVLLQNDREDSVDRTRSIIVASMLPEIKGVISLSLGMETSRFYQDWNYSNNAGVIIAVFDEELPQPVQRQAEIHIDFDAFRDEVSRISGIIQKVPDKTEVHPITPKLILVLRMGILVPIEKALLARGFESELRSAKDELEKRHFQQSAIFEKLVGGTLENVFVDWNFHHDDSAVCFQLK
ncbi:DUF2294 domain-containing protein [Paenibacillus sp. TRM 82003]|nr:DUF2294 domain-containing protein [Paenibacillus sp. TRM 82003]